METVTDFIFLDSKITADGDCSHENEKMLDPLQKSYDKPRQCIKKQRHDFTNTGLYSQSYVFVFWFFFQQSCTDERVGP